ncbi:BRO family protein [Myxococcus sp. AB036A]|uniref:BRO-N domain-containing protein n=1 Tax=Myxococcus sp. AB036A TaxID=2562793 RepID=UPI001E630A59|nr:BRO family protein [Myxococcus sp. AB036A]
MHQLADFNFEAHRIRVSMDERGEPWFVAADVCAALGIANSRDALGRLGDDEKGVGTTDTPGGLQKVATVNEPGVYRIVFTSRVAGAERFKRWLAHEVLPTLRKTGSYTAPGAPTPQPLPTLPPPLQVQVLAHLEVARTLASFVPGLKPELAAACALDAIHRDTGLTMEPHRRGLPAAAEPPARLNATQLGQKVRLSARKMNLRLEACGLQRRNEREEWELTDAGRDYAEAVPFSRNGHAAYQLLWRPEVLGVLEDAARSSAFSVGLG